ncbi:uncharacterized protein H6S33_005575 [Morchella sextelata]|uniref:uncharacterized protein n=1 Tax=Morchella sextelata TaxID=1174677 RepID=UPI001D059CB9|nr:uncharacterized protein H6S33_005575 [Morchella sextelata]KAH0613689.1 hypothetical protein H6S33_005575 [Morchella sextelata]
MAAAAAADKGWESYPKRLLNYDPLREDGVSYDARLAKDNKRLFTEKGNINVDVLDIFRDEFAADNKKPVTYQDTDAFEECLTSSPPNREFRFYTLKPANPNVISRSRVAIPEDTLRKLLTVHQVMPGFIDFLQAFGRKASSSDTGFGGCKRRIEYATPNSSKQRNMKSYGMWIIRVEDVYYNGTNGYASEICYNIKFAEEHGRKEKEDEPPKDPWSIRQTCIYQKFEYEKKSSTWIMVQPSDKATTRLNEVFKARAEEYIEDTVHNPMDIHLVFLSGAAENWRWYYNYLENKLYDMTTGALSSAVGRRGKTVTFGNYNQHLDFEVEFKDVQELQRFEEKVQSLLLALETNRDTITTLQKHNDQLRNCGLGLEEHHFTAVDDSLDTYLTELAIYKRNVEALLQRIRGRSRLLYNILDYRNAETAHRHGQKNVDFAELGRRDTDLMMKMTKRTTREAVAVKIVTFVTLFYLPATFVAVCFLYSWQWSCN